jgi:23S rRNA (adenine-N6)-dimethyltransferase
MPRTTRRDLSQNFLRDRRVAADLCAPVAASPLPVVELGAGAGAVTAELVRLGHEVTAVEVDPRLVGVLRRRFGGSVRVVQADMLRFRLPRTRYNVVSNVPYSITTSLLRTLLASPGWEVAALMVQWEVARKRTGGTVLSASWWPWFDIDLVRRVPARAFRPVPRVDSGILRITRRTDSVLPEADRAAYQRLVAAVFTGRGSGLAGILRAHLPRGELRRWLRAHDVSPVALPRDLTSDQWLSLYRAVSARTG